MIYEYEDLMVVFTMWLLSSMNLVSCSYTFALEHKIKKILALPLDWEVNLKLAEVCQI